MAGSSPSNFKLRHYRFQSFNTARRSIQGFETVLWLRKGFGFVGPWTVIEQNRKLGFCFELPGVNEA